MKSKHDDYIAANTSKATHPENWCLFCLKCVCTCVRALRVSTLGHMQSVTKWIIDEFLLLLYCAYAFETWAWKLWNANCKHFTSVVWARYYSDAMSKAMQCRRNATKNKITALEQTAYHAKYKRWMKSKQNPIR